jgi:hypothetical protein
MGSLALRLTCLPREASPAKLLQPTLAWLLVERVIYKVNSSQFTRSARLGLALRINTNEESLLLAPVGSLDGLSTKGSGRILRGADDRSPGYLGLSF